MFSPGLLSDMRLNAASLFENEFSPHVALSAFEDIMREDRLSLLREDRFCGDLFILQSGIFYPRGRVRGGQIEGGGLPEAD